MNAVKNTIDEKKKQRRGSGNASSKPLSPQKLSEPLILESHLGVAFNTIAKKLSKERKGYTAPKVFVIQEDDSID